MNSETPKTPMTSHPAFRWGVGIWFGLLLGLGLYVMPAEVHDTLAQRLGLDRILSDEEMRRGVLAGGAALVGLVIGLLLAIRIGAINEAAAIDYIDDGDELEPDPQWLAEADESDPEPAAAQAQRFLNPREDIGEQGIGAATHVDVEEVSPPENMQDAAADDYEEVPVDEPEYVEASATTAPVEVSPAPSAVPEDPVSHDRAPEPEESLPEAANLADRALGDLSLAELTDRLGLALDAFKNAPHADNRPGNDPVVDGQDAYDSPEDGQESQTPDHESELRSALEKLGRFNTSR